MSSRAGEDLLDQGTDGRGPPRNGFSTIRSSRRSRWLRALGFVAVLGAAALVIVPVSYKYEGLGLSGRRDCGVPLQALFQPPGEKCGATATRRGYMAVVAIGLGGTLLAFGGVRRVRILGLTVLGASPFLLMFQTNGNNPVEVGNQIYVCGSVVGDLARRGYREVSGIGVTPACGDMALNWLYLWVGMAAVGAAIVGVDAIRHRRAPKAAA